MPCQPAVKRCNSALECFLLERFASMEFFQHLFDIIFQVWTVSDPQFAVSASSEPIDIVHIEEAPDVPPCTPCTPPQ